MQTEILFYLQNFSEGYLGNSCLSSVGSKERLLGFAVVPRGVQCNQLCVPLSYIKATEPPQGVTQSPGECNTSQLIKNKQTAFSPAIADVPEAIVNICHLLFPGHVLDSLILGL